MSRRIASLSRAFIAVYWIVAGAPAWAALECEQLVAVAQTAVKLRDEGSSLNAVMNDIERGEIRQQLDSQEFNVLRQIVRMSFTSEASVAEILDACKAGELGLPKPKSKR